MRVLLIVYDNENHISYFPLGIAYVASYLRKEGHDVTIYEQNVYHYTEQELTDYLKANSFDVVGLGVIGGYYQYRKAYKIAMAIDSLGESKPFFMMGGHLAAPDPEFFLRKFKADVAVIGEGEITDAEVISAYENKTDFKDILGIAYIDENDRCVITPRREAVKNVDSFPWPAWDLFTMEHYVLQPFPRTKPTDRTMEMLSGRGCPYHCNFCYRMEPGFRPRSTQAILEEMWELKNRYHVSYICFDDELLMSSIPRTKEIARAIIDSGINVRWWCEGRLNFAYKDKEMLELMSEAGCVFINYGIESMDDGALERMHKNITTEMIIKGIENTEAAGISPGLNIIFGNLGEDMEVLKKDVEFLLKYDDQAQVRTIRPVTPYPGTELFKIAQERGLVKDVEDFYENKHTNSDLLTCNFTPMTDEEFYNALDWANGVLLDNYTERIKQSNRVILTDLYKKHNANFRGFRQT